MSGQNLLANIGASDLSLMHGYTAIVPGYISGGHDRVTGRPREPFLMAAALTNTPMVSGTELPTAD